MTTMLSQSQTVLISLLAKGLFGNTQPLPETVDWESVMREAEQNAVLTQVFPAAQPFLPEQIAQKAVSRFYQYLANNVRVHLAHGSLHQILQNAQIPYVVIKGSASARYYSEPGLRIMGDIDIYVQKDRLEDVDALLLQSGYQLKNRVHQNHWSYEKDGLETEVHWAIGGVPVGSRATFQPLFADLIETASVGNVMDNPMMLPDDIHHGVVILLHTVSHLTSGGIGLRHLLDWIVFERCFSEPEFSSMFQAKLQAFGLWEFARTVSAIGTLYFGCEPRGYSADVEPELADHLLADVLNGGNFGVKDKNRVLQAKFFRNEENRQISGRPTLWKAFGFLNRRARQLMPSAERCPLLLPIGLIRVAHMLHKTRQTKQLLRMDWNQTMSGAREREELYEQFHFFETQDRN